MYFNSILSHALITPRLITETQFIHKIKMRGACVQTYLKAYAAEASI